MKKTERAPTEPTDWREGRRKRAWGLHAQGWNGWNQIKIAQALGVTQGAVSQWLKAARAGGGEFSAPSGIAVGTDGRLYVLDREQGNVQVFRPSK